VVRRLVGLARLTHPFPSTLNALATGLIATLAGATPGTAVRLAGSMLALQASIGSLNDLRDAESDAGRKPGKPIPRGLVSRRAAWRLSLAGLALGLLLSAPSGWGTVLVALAGVACGYAYDLRLSRTAVSWLPLAAALPLLPIHAWLGASGEVPPSLVPLVPVAILAGAGVAIGNGVVDVDRDRGARRAAVAVRLGRRWAWGIHAALLATVIGLAFVLVPFPERTPLLPGTFDIFQRAGLFLGSAVLALGVVLVGNPKARVRERGWELEAVGVATLGISWLAAVAGIGRDFGALP
jgi:4-hydroxybenzoate polyprenyltransferase